MRIVRAVTLIVALPMLSVACVPPVTAADAGADAGATPLAAFNGGTRLRPRVLATRSSADGDARLLNSWRDTALDFECEFQRADDGHWRCLPLWDSRDPHITENDILFQNADCTNPVRALRSDVAANPTFVLGLPRQSSTCTEPSFEYPVHTLGEPIVPTTLFYRSGGECQSTSVDTTSFRYVRLGDRVPPDRFAAAELVLAPVDARLAVRTLYADDGARQWAGMLDRSRNAPCSPSPFGESDTFCLPTHPAFVPNYYFADSACTDVIAYQSPPIGNATCAAPAVILDARAARGTCPAPMRLRAVGAEVPASSVFIGTPAMCAASPSNTHHRYFRVGDPIATHEFPRIVAAPVGVGRLRSERFVTELGAPVSGSRGFYDTELAAQCADAMFADGTLRCLPASAANDLQLYADAACTRPLAYPYVSPCGMRGAEIIISLDAEARIGAIHAMGARHDGPVYRDQQMGAGCVAAQRQSEPTFEYHVLGDPIPFSRYVVLEHRLE